MRPVGASIDPLTGVFTWQPRDDQGGKTHTIPVVVTDAGYPAMTDTRTFQVVVLDDRDTFSARLGVTNLLAGHTAAVPIYLNAAASLTQFELQFTAVDPHLESLMMVGVGGGGYGRVSRLPR